MTDIETLVARLRDAANGIGGLKSAHGDYGLLDDAADAIRTLQTEKVELRDCLQQFVNGVETHMIDSPADDILANVTHRAKAALSNTGEME